MQFLQPELGLLTNNYEKIFFNIHIIFIFVAYTLGQADYNDAAAALASSEMADTPAILSSGILLKKCAVLKNDTVILEANCEDL